MKSWQRLPPRVRHPAAVPILAHTSLLLLLPATTLRSRRRRGGVVQQPVAVLAARLLRGAGAAAALPRARLRASHHPAGAAA